MSNKGKISTEQISDNLMELINGSKVEFIRRSFILRNITNTVPISIPEFNKNSDLLMVFKNTTFLDEGLMYNISLDGRNIISTEGEWDGTIVEVLFNFVVIRKAKGNVLDTATTDIYTKIEKLNDRVHSINRVPLKTVSVTVHPEDTHTSINKNILNHLEYQGADVVLNIMCNITSATDPNVTTITDEGRVQHFINEIHATDVKVKMLKPHIGINFSDSFNRRDYNPSDYTIFFTKWTNILLKYAEVCKVNNIPYLCIGCEQEQNTRSNRKGNWRAIYNTIKSAYPELILTYACNFQEWYLDTDNAIYENVDSIGLNVYLQWYPTEYTPGLTSKDIAKCFYSSYQSMYGQGGTNTVKRIKYLADKYNKRIIITELGLMPYPDGLISLISKYKDNISKRDFNIPAIVFEAALQVLCNVEYVDGISFWHMMSPFNYFDYDTNQPYSPAEEVIRKYFKGGLL